MSESKIKTPTVEQMLETGVHFGHPVRRKHPRMEKYIYGAENKAHIIDLFQTQELLDKALKFLYQVASQGKQIVFVGTKRQAAEIIGKYAKESGALFVNQRWLGGTLTNFESIKANCNALIKMEEGIKTNAFAHYTKKERLLIERKIEKLNSLIGGIKNIEKYPGALVIVDVKREKTAVREANALGIPVVALVDTNSDPENIDFAVPANDDAMKSIDLMFATFAKVLKDGYEDAKKAKPEKSEKVVAQASEVPAKETPVKETPQAKTAAKAVKKPTKTEVTKKAETPDAKKKVAKAKVKAKS